MNQIDTKERDAISIGEWYDFIGQLSDVLPALHLGGATATNDLIEMLQLGSDDRVLDVGCGAGQTACKIVKEHGSRIIGIDISDIMISRAQDRAKKQRVEDKVEFRVADVLQIPFNDGSFDAAIFESVLTIIPGNKMDALEEIIRVIRPGGLIGANETIYYPTAPPELFKLAEKHPAIHGMFTPEKLKSLFVESGLLVTKIKEVKNAEAPSVTKEMGIVGIFSFMIKSYWRVLSKFLTDSRFRKTQKIDNRLTGILKEHGGYFLIVGKKPK
jgi:ubiquinone/menaquinone biosynthesis C-methylase UbiE